MRQDLIQTRAPDESLPTGPYDFLCLCQSYHRTDNPYKLHTPSDEINPGQMGLAQNAREGAN